MFIGLFLTSGTIFQSPEMFFLKTLYKFNVKNDQVYLFFPFFIFFAKYPSLFFFFIVSGKEVTKRWGNLRDAFSKSKKKMKECKKSGAGAPNIKKYVYADQMQFLNKLFEQASTVAESLEATVENNEDEDPTQDSTHQAQQPPENTVGENSKPRQYKRRRQPDEIELRMIKALEEPPQCPKMSFYQGLMPHLNKFDDSEFLEFQMGVLEVITKINNKRKITAQPQPQFFPQQTPSYHPNSYNPIQNYAFQPQPPNPTQPPFQSHQFPNPQNHQFKNPANPNNTDTNPQQAHSSKGQPLEHQQTTRQYFQDFGNTFAVKSPVETYPLASPSPNSSLASDSTYDFS